MIFKFRRLYQNLERILFSPMVKPIDLKRSIPTGAAQEPQGRERGRAFVVLNFIRTPSYVYPVVTAQHPAAAFNIMNTLWS